MLQTIQKIGPVLDLFTPERPEWGVAEVAEKLRLPRSSTHAILASLADTGLLAPTARGRYRIGWRIAELSETLRASLDVRAHAVPVLRELVGTFGETVHLAVMERDKVLYVDKIVGTHMVNVVGARVGAHLDAHCTAVGKVLLAQRDPADLDRWLARAELRRLTPATITDPAMLRNELHQVRVAGCAYDVGEAVAEVHCVAAPVTDDRGVVVAAVSMTVPASRFLPRKAELKRAVMSAGGRISAAIAAATGAAPRPARRRKGTH
ncbi:IclR family transcriptional regulator [Amycolatopsis sp. ATCC 39116]|uniref:IclR family transcriptional regulator n=1 Tax=Amycolatopsis sp. (strain ATCC 39116 / 75iv2) TaxID=385957 RepID=UPI0002629039|nr:IclR family transcriptional regulator [Amycolatopsis sp. ATCC 39116]